MKKGNLERSTLQLLVLQWQSSPLEKKFLAHSKGRAGGRGDGKREKRAGSLSVLVTRMVV